MIKQPVPTYEEIELEKAKTREHILNVIRFTQQMLHEIERSVMEHDATKLQEPEASAFARANSQDFLKGVTYGSDEYKKQLRGMLGPALRHHYDNNRHHPEHHIGAGVAGMTLMDLMEMLADWKAATLRHADGDIKRSIEINAERFNLDPQLTDILTNTVQEMGW